LKFVLSKILQFTGQQLDYAILMWIGNPSIHTILPVRCPYYWYRHKGYRVPFFVSHLMEQESMSDNVAGVIDLMLLLG